MIPLACMFYPYFLNRFLKYLFRRLELADLKSRYSKCLDIEGQLRDEVERLNKQLLDSDDVNNRLLVSMEKENNELKQTISNLQTDLHDRDCEIFKLSSNFQVRNLI